MRKFPVQRLAKVLRFMISALIVCNIVAFLLVPAFVVLTPEAFFEYIVEKVLHLLGIKPLPPEQAEMYMFAWWSVAAVIASWAEVWTKAEWILNTLFLFVCGALTLVILLQARKILDTILSGNPFQMVNAVCLTKAAGCCWSISGIAVTRLIVELLYYRHPAPFFTYNALFIPVFLIGGLLLLVMSALFRQAAQLQEDQDLTI